MAQIVRLVKKHHPTWDMETEVTHRRPEDNLRPDIVAKTPNGTIIADAAVTWDASVGITESMNRFNKRKRKCLLSGYPGPARVLGLSFGARSLISASTQKNGKILELILVSPG